MDSDLGPLVANLSTNIDSLAASLTPLLTTPLATSTSKLPLLDKAKLYVLTTYAIESLLFSYLRLNGTDAKSHPVFQELTRVKHYFEKIKAVETGAVTAKPNQRLDKAAAGRFVKAALAGNDDYDRSRKDAQDREKAAAKRKLEDMPETVGRHTRFGGSAKRMKAAEANGEEHLVRATDGDGQQENDDGNDDGDDDDDDDSAEAMDEDIADGSSNGRSKKPAPADSNKDRKRSKKSSRLDSATTDIHSTEASDATTRESTSSKRQKSNKAPRGASEAFKALLQGSMPSDEEASKKKKKRKSRG